MTDDHDPVETPVPEDGTEEEVRGWLKDALGEEAPAPVDVLAGVQKKLRERSGGKFYKDAWSTTKDSPTLIFLVTSALMLVVVALTYAILSPIQGAAELVPTAPAPVNVMVP